MRQHRRSSFSRHRSHPSRGPAIISRLRFRPCRPSCRNGSSRPRRKCRRRLRPSTPLLQGSEVSRVRSSSRICSRRGMEGCSGSSNGFIRSTLPPTSSTSSSSRRATEARRTTTQWCTPVPRTWCGSTTSCRGHTTACACARATSKTTTSKRWLSDASCPSRRPPSRTSPRTAQPRPTPWPSEPPGPRTTTCSGLGSPSARSPSSSSASPRRRSRTHTSSCPLAEGRARRRRGCTSRGPSLQTCRWCSRQRPSPPHRATRGAWPPTATRRA
mmetsp:Transcript_3258/g.7733  ORF Transcript_3258/g.7733 Transcript_3258/m.7733 type:complete len:271 (+) Transcript_3258:1733-2545(+)